jgi:GDP-4-dehydro-6-deoxy-D-mannose reductase
VTALPWDFTEPDGPPEATQRAVEEFAPDCIFHLAALSVPADCGDDAPVARAMAVNVDGTRRVMELAAALPDDPRVLFTSSSHVYAPVSSEAPVVDETAAVGPTRGYGQSKWLAEEEVRKAIDRLGCDGVIVRSFQHAGPRQNARMMLAEWTRQFVGDDTRPVEVFTRDAQIDLSDGRDVVRAYRLLAEQGQSGEVYNVGSGVCRRSGDVLDMLRAMAGPKRRIVELHPGFKQDAIADTGRLTRCIGWRPSIPVEQTVADTFAWWRRFATSQR